MGLFRSIAGMMRVEITSADISGALAAIAERNIAVFSVRQEDDLTLRLEIFRRDHPNLAALCERRGERLKILGKRGFYWTGTGLLKRPVLLAGIGFLMAAALYLPTRVFFVQVEGNVSIPTNQILEAAEESGIRFGASRREVRSERMKNALLEALPQLQWAGVNTSGCVATISVRERTAAQEAKGEESSVSSIVAVCDGVILSSTVTRGNGLCRPGQAVTEGQVLISGYTDLGLTIQATRAEGEVFARTRRELEVMTPANALQRGQPRGESVKYSLIVGKNRINLWKGSGICEGSCGRMYEEYYVTLPGGFRLPIALVKETVILYDTESAEVEQSEAEDLLTRFAERYLCQQMVSGTILEQDAPVTQADGVYLLEGEFLCTEMIGRQRQEKIGE